MSTAIPLLSPSVCLSVCLPAASSSSLRESSPSPIHRPSCFRVCRLHLYFFSLLLIHVHHMFVHFPSMYLFAVAFCFITGEIWPKREIKNHPSFIICRTFPHQSSYSAWPLFFYRRNKIIIHLHDLSHISSSIFMFATAFSFLTDQIAKKN